MKAVVYNKKSKPNKLVLTVIDKPHCLDNEVLIKVQYSSINAADYRLYKMGFPPKKKIFGADVSGVIEAVGKNVTKFNLGDEVFGDFADYGFGGFAEYVAINENAIVIKPEGISFLDAAALPLAASTALQALRDKGQIKAGQNVLIVGSGGGVGTFAVQIAKYYGANVTALCGPKNIEQTKLLGADKVLDYTNNNFADEKNKYDIILAVNGNYSLTAYKRSLKENGRCVVIGGELSQFFRTVTLGKLVFIGSKSISLLYTKQNKNDLEFLAQLVAQNKIKPVISNIYSLAETPEAMEKIAQGHSSGKCIIKVYEDI